MHNASLADLFKQTAVYEAMQNEAWRARAYEKAALAIESLDRDVADIYRAEGLKGLEKISGVGVSIAEKIVEYLTTRQVRAFEKLKKQFPVNVSELYAVEGLGPKKIKLLWEKLKIKNLSDLERAASAHRLATLPRLGAKTEANILRAIAFLRGTGHRQLLGTVLPLARTIEDRFRKLAGVTQAVVAGSVRRRQETIGDIDLLVATKKPALAQKTFITLPEVAAVKVRGPGRSEVRLYNGLDADIRVVAPDSFGAALQYFTGDKAHNVALRTLARARRLKLNEYGLWRGKRLVAGKTEAAVYRALGLDPMPPELRQASGELEAARNHTLPALLPYGAVKGDLQVQTNWTDGSASIETMVQAAIEKGFEYIAISDHTRTLAMTGGLDEAGLARQGQEIDQISRLIRAGKFGEKHKKFRLLKSAEINILKDGSLDIEDDALQKLDVVSAAIHTHFHLSRAEQTKRLLTALAHPRLHVLFHPTGRLINRRPPYEFDSDAVMAAARRHRVALEVNSFPDRLDLRDEHVRQAVRAGVKLVINTDAHAPEHFKYLELGEATARRGWATKKDVLNTLSAEKLLAYFKKKPRRVIK